MTYNANYAMQMQSYKLSEDLGDDDVLSFYADMSYDPAGSASVNPSLDGNEAACATFVHNAGGGGLKKGCHSFGNVVGCVIIFVAQ